jgi:hypothetical protein
MMAIALTASRSALAVISASGGGGGASTTTSYNGNRIDGFVIVEEVAYDSGSGPWEKKLINVGSGSGNMLFSGVPAAIDETFTNAGSAAWTDWHERILSTTTIGDNENYLAFNFGMTP